MKNPYKILFHIPKILNGREFGCEFGSSIEGQYFNCKNYNESQKRIIYYPTYDNKINNLLYNPIGYPGQYLLHDVKLIRSIKNDFEYNDTYSFM